MKLLKRTPPLNNRAGGSTTTNPGLAVYGADFLKKRRKAFDFVKPTTAPNPKRSDDQALEEAKKNGYFVGAAGSSVFKMWWRWCSDHRLPYVRVFPKRLYASVGMDLIHLSGGTFANVDPKGAAAVDALLRAHVVDGGKYLVGASSYCSKVRVEEAPAIAAQLFAIGHATIARPR